MLPDPRSASPAQCASPNRASPRAPCRNPLDGSLQVLGLLPLAPLFDCDGDCDGRGHAGGSPPRSACGLERRGYNCGGPAIACCLYGRRSRRNKGRDRDEGQQQHPRRAHGAKNFSYFHGWFLQLSLTPPKSSPQYPRGRPNGLSRNLDGDGDRKIEFPVGGSTLV